MRGHPSESSLDRGPYGPYGTVVSRTQKKGAEEARSQLPSLLADAEKGTVTISTRHGRGIAAIVPLKELRAGGQRSLMALAGSGKGLWSSDSTGTLRKLRDEWKR